MSSPSATPTATRLPYLAVFDGYRGFAVLAVVFSHIVATSAWEPSGEFLLALRKSSFVTPEFLFIVSGFLLFMPIAAKGGLSSRRAFAVRRLGRIVPAYLVSLLITIAYIAATKHPPLPVGELEAFALHLVFLHHEFGVSGFGVNEVYWTLSLIAIFYLLLALLADRYLRHPLIGVALAMMLVVGWRVGLEGNVGYLPFIQFPLFAADFAIGMTAGWLYIRLVRSGAEERARRFALPLGLLALGAAVLTLYTIGLMRVREEIFYFYGIPPALALALPLAFAAVMLTVAFMPSWARWPLSNRLARWTGTVSYGLLLFHVLILQIAVRGFGLERDGSFLTFLTLSAIVVPSSLAAGWLSYKYVEAPARSWVRAWAARFDRPAPELRAEPGRSAPPGALAPAGDLPRPGG